MAAASIPLFPPGDPTSHPLAAQIPLTNFTLPTFPPEASHLRSLTLTSDIHLPDYQSLLTGPHEYDLPLPPPSITHLTLELFSLGFPGRNPHFLANLARALPNLKSITFFACLIDGLDDYSRDDALEFFQLLPLLQEVHVIDSFVRPGFWTAVSKIWSSHASSAAGNDEATKANTALNSPPLPSTTTNGATPVDDAPDSTPGIKIIDISYTYRGHTDSDFLARIHGEELPRLIVPGIVGAGFNLIEPRVDELDTANDYDEKKVNGSNNEDQAQKKKEKDLPSGILPFAPTSRATIALRAHLATLTSRSATALSNLKVLNLAMWTLKPEELSSLSGTAPASTPSSAANSSSDEKEGKRTTKSQIIHLTLSLLLSPSYLPILRDTLLNQTPHLQNLEIVGVPTDDNRTMVGNGIENGNVDENQRQDWFLGTVKFANDATEVKGLGEAVEKAAHGQGQEGDEGERGEGLKSVEMSILRARKAGGVRWIREGKGGEWKLDDGEGK